MLHFSCDLCGVRLDDDRYVVRLEVAPAFDPDMITEADLDADNLEEVANLLAAAEVEGGEIDRDEPQEFRYDLCPQCRDRFCQDPLGKGALRRLNFSQN